MFYSSQGVPLQAPQTFSISQYEKEWSHEERRHFLCRIPQSLHPFLTHLTHPSSWPRVSLDSCSSIFMQGLPFLCKSYIFSIGTDVSYLSVPVWYFSNSPCATASVSTVSWHFISAQLFWSPRWLQFMYLMPVCSDLGLCERESGENCSFLQLYGTFYS